MLAARRLRSTLCSLQTNRYLATRPSPKLRRGFATTTAAAGSSPLKVGFIGAGDISNLHAEGIAACNGAVLHGLWSRTDKQVPSPADKAAEYNCRLYGSAEELCADETIDAVFVLTNFEVSTHVLRRTLSYCLSALAWLYLMRMDVAQTHEHYATMAIEAGKHVMVEKPVGADVGELERLKALAELQGVVCMPGHNYVYEPPLQRARDMVANGDLGKLTSIYVMYNIHHPEAVCARYPGVIRQIMTHHAYTALYLLDGDKPKSLSCFRATIRDADEGTAPQENHAMMNLQTESGCMVHLCASFAADDHASDAWSFYVKLIGTRGATRHYLCYLFIIGCSFVFCSRGV